MSLDAWLERLQPGAAAWLAPMLRALPGLPTFGGAPPDAPEARVLACAEWSEREGSHGLRLAYTLDTARLPRGWLAGALRQIDPGLPADALREAEAAHAADPDLGMLVGVDAGAGRRAKLYVYPEGDRAPVARMLGLAGIDPDACWREVDALGLPTSFVALDLRSDGRHAAKAYLRAARRAEAAGALDRLGQTELAARARALPEVVEADPHALVITLRTRGGGWDDVTLHARARRLDAAALAGPGLAERLAAHAEAARALGLALLPTHVAWLSTGPRTVYYQVR